MGYCKISCNKEVKILLGNEEKMLKHLKEKGIIGIPICYLNDQYEKKVNILIQSTSKTARSRIIHILTPIHWEFLMRLNSRTKQILNFKNSDFFNSIHLLKTNLSFLSNFDVEIVISTILEIETKYAGIDVEFSVCHADFTPWNMFLEKGELFVFDWEYAVFTCPPYLDAFHFFTQTHIYVKHSDSEKIYRSFIIEKRIFEKHITDPVFVYKNYLLFIISFYVERDKGEFSSEISRNISIWTKLLEFLK
jgi:thiamine kinase-like enzyme